MPFDFPESDWKIFRELREPALERFCERTLKEIELIIQDRVFSAHERYAKIFELLDARDKQLAAAFDDPRRSRMLYQLRLIDRLGLINSVEKSRFSDITQQRIAS